MDLTAYQALRERCAWIDLTGRGKIRVTGEDRVRLLHAMCTNNVEQLQPGSGCYAFFLTAQGKILADANVYCMPDYLLLDTEPETKQRVMDHLDKFIIADDATLHDFTAATATLAIEGPEAEKVVNNLGGMPAATPLSLVEWGRCQVANWNYTGGRGYTIFADIEDRGSLLQRLAAAGVPQADLPAADAVRLENFRPRYGLDFSEAQIPQETQQMQAVHFSKGCYLGQEIVERVRSRGHVNRQLSRITIDSQDVPQPGATVELEGKSVGEITSAVFSPDRQKVLGFAIIRAEALQPSAALSVNGVPATAEASRVPTVEF